MGDSAPEVLGFQAFAQRIMRAPSYVTQLRKAGRLVLSADGKGVLVAESIKLIADTLVRLGRRPTYVNLESGAGHDAFLVDYQPQGPIITDFLDSLR